MEIEKVKAAMTALCLFLLSALFCFFFIGTIYLLVSVIRFFIEVYDLVEALWLGIFTAWLLHLAFVSLVYTIRFAVVGKNKIAEYYRNASSSSQIVPETPTSNNIMEADDDHQQQQEPQNLRRGRNKVNKVMVRVTRLLCAVTSVYLGVWVLVMVINEVVHGLRQGQHNHGKVGMARVRMVLMLIASLFIFLLFVLVIPVSCIYGTKHCCGGNKSSSPAPKEHDEILEANIILQEQRSDANP